MEGHLGHFNRVVLAEVEGATLPFSFCGFGAGLGFGRGCAGGLHGGRLADRAGEASLAERRGEHSGERPGDANLAERLGEFVVGSTWRGGVASLAERRGDAGLGDPVVVGAGFLRLVLALGVDVVPDALCVNSVKLSSSRASLLTSALADRSLKMLSSSGSRSSGISSSITVIYQYTQL